MNDHWSPLWHCIAVHWAVRNVAKKLTMNFNEMDLGESQTRTITLIQCAMDT